jgi:hypothetical protein
MTIRHLKPTHPDFRAHLEPMKAAFVGSDSPKAEFEEMVTRITERHASFYRLSARGGCVRFCGRAVEGDYHIIALVGRGLLAVAPSIIERVKACGYQAITYHTYKRGMRRLLTVLGFEVIETIQHSNGVVETIHRLDLKG